MKSFVPYLALMFVLAGCFTRVGEVSDSSLLQYVGRRAEVRKQITVYDHGAFGGLGVPTGEWLVLKDEKVKTTLEPGTTFEVIGVVSRLLPSGKHYYFACRYHTAGVELKFDYPADQKFINADHILWR